MVLLEFQAANGSSSLLQVEYAKEEPELKFVYGVHVRVVLYKTIYEVAQNNLAPGETYHIRVVPRIGLFRGLASNTTQVTMPAPGKFHLQCYGGWLRW